MKPVQYFSDEYLEQRKEATPEAILEFLETFRLMNDASARSKLISIKVPNSLLESFRRKCERDEVRYQTQTKKLIKGMAKAG